MNIETTGPGRVILEALADTDGIAGWPVEQHQALSSALLAVGVSELARIVEIFLRRRMSAAADAQLATIKARGQE
jgi:hypothetical protein